MIRAIDRADVTIWGMAFQADLLLRSGFSRDINRTIEIAEHCVIQLLYAVELGLEVCSRAGSNMAFYTRYLRVRDVLGRDELRLHRDVTTLPAKIDRLGVLIGFVAAERSQKKKADSAEREQRKNSPVAFPR